MNTFIKASAFLMLSAGLLSGCKKMIEVKTPVNQVVSTGVFTTDSLATSAVLGIYSEMMNAASLYSSGLITLYPGLSAHELQYFSPSLRDEFSMCNIDIGNHQLLNSSFWNAAYKHIYAANLCYEQLLYAPITPLLREELKGEVLFLRSFIYFHLVNLFGDVPLVLSTDYKQTSATGRTAVATIYSQIIEDLRIASAILPRQYRSPNRVRATKWAAEALLSRVYLYQKRWQEAADAASNVMNSGLFNLSPLSSVFLKNSSESILQLHPVNPTQNTWEARELIPASANETPKYILTETTLKAFAPDDKRRAAWVGSRVFGGQDIFYPAKYKVYGNGAPLTEFYMLLRLGEQYLIRAEALAQLSDIPGAENDLNAVRRRAGLEDTTAVSQEELLRLIGHERQVELFAEWGHRWYDLKRTGRINEIMSELLPSTWSPSDALYPIPLEQLNRNPNLKQNPGY